MPVPARSCPLLRSVPLVLSVAALQADQGVELVEGHEGVRDALPEGTTRTVAKPG
jgi:hypothetical protein